MRQLVQLATEYLAMASFPLFAFVLVAAEPIVRLLFGEEFVRGADALRVLMAAFLVICFGYVGGWMTVVLKLQKQFIRFALIALVFNVALNLILIPKYGYMAAAWLTLGTELLVQSLTLGLVFRRLELRPRFSRFARTALAAAAMGGLVFARQIGRRLARLDGHHRRRDLPAAAAHAGRAHARSDRRAAPPRGPLTSTSGRALTSPNGFSGFSRPFMAPNRPVRV